MESEESFSESNYKDALDICAWQDKVDMLKKKEEIVSIYQLGYFACV